MARMNAAKRESVWFDTEIRKAPEFDAIGASAFGLWTRLPFLVGDDHTLPELSVIARDADMLDADVVWLLSELLAVGFVERVSAAGDDRVYRMSALSRRYYSFTDPADGEKSEANA